jgi:hypothetical protein
VRFDHGSQEDEGIVNEQDRIRWARALVFAGWMFVLAYLAYLVTQVRRAAAVRNASFDDGVWGQRIELVSFAALPQNVVILVPAVIAVVAASWLVRPLVDPVVVHVSRLIRTVAGFALLIVALALLGITEVFFRSFDPVGDVTAILLRVGGGLIGVAIVRVCTEAEHDT